MKIYFLYLLSEIIGFFLLGIAIFISIISLTQFLQISEFVLVHNVKVPEILHILALMSLSFLPLVMPMSLLFSVLLTYAKLSGDSEIIALNALGYSFFQIALPALLFSLLIGLVSLQTLFVVGPQARFKFDQRIQTIGGETILEKIQPKIFIENFFGMVIYFNEKTKDGQMKSLFIKDVRDRKHPVTIIADRGNLSVDKDDSDQTAVLELFDGRSFQEKEGILMEFQNYSVRIKSPISVSRGNRDPNTYTARELEQETKSSFTSPKDKSLLKIEWHRRVTTAFSCLLFGFLGSALGLSVNRRSASSRGFSLSIICLVVYWIFVATSLSLAEKYPQWMILTMWLPNLIFSLFTIALWNTFLSSHILRRKRWFFSFF